MAQGPELRTLFFAPPCPPDPSLTLGMTWSLTTSYVADIDSSRSEVRTAPPFFRFVRQRRTSATLHAWAAQPRGWNGGSASKISAIVPMVSHVDHTEHDVDVMVTEQGLADLRGLDPTERAETIIRQCAHPDYRGLLSDYLTKAKKEPGHIPFSLEEAHLFHLRLKATGSMKETAA